MSKVNTVCVYCGASQGTNPAYREAARALGQAFAQQGIRLVYGGGSVGIMGALASAVLDGGGQVTGVIPEFLTDLEHTLKRTQEVIVTRDMHERKRIMFERADAFVALPGGIGTLEELVEQLTWQQLGRHKKPVLLANIEHFWDPLCALLDHMKALQFIRPSRELNVLVEDRVERILGRLAEAAAQVSEAETVMQGAAARRL